jgi:hypothetical protein
MGATYLVGSVIRDLSFLTTKCQTQNRIKTQFPGTEKPASSPFYAGPLLALADNIFSAE